MSNAVTPIIYARKVEMAPTSDGYRPFIIRYDITAPFSISTLTVNRQDHSVLQGSNLSYDTTLGVLKLAGVPTKDAKHMLEHAQVEMELKS